LLSLYGLCPGQALSYLSPRLDLPDKAASPNTSHYHLTPCLATTGAKESPFGHMDEFGRRTLFLRAVRGPQPHLDRPCVSIAYMVCVIKLNNFNTSKLIQKNATKEYWVVVGDQRIEELREHGRSGAR
jgi:hypothetical protein